MNMKQVIVFGAAMIAASASFADSYDLRIPDAASTKSRAEVIAEVKAARANGTLEVHDGNYPMTPQSSAPGRTREEVVAELRQFRAAHPYFNVETDYPDAFQSPSEPSRVAGMNAATTTR